ncbi:4-alpha-glucanotransferase [Novosphingobium colocasiae]|uniref:4-alpha-glucanotransferase n=1 Tax=Novosphingobium colocasiae TaxID=1256513 RepID=UPI001E539B0E|nr:4-alpha-glucanotransferase [Novosphingobium colocasiae]
MVADGSLIRIATALGYPAGTGTEIAASLDRIAQERREPPAMLVTGVGLPTPLPPGLIELALAREDGTPVPGDQPVWELPPIGEPGYYRLTIGEHRLTLAVAPDACPTVADLLPESRRNDRLWGAAVQVPALRSARPQAFGTFAQLAEAVELFAGLGADALAINPVHALFPGNGHGFSPYSPSSRLYLNAAMGDPGLVGLPAPPLGEAAAADGLIAWESAMPERQAHLRAVFDGLDAQTRARIVADNAAYEPGLTRQAVYDALDCRYRPQGAHGWPDWPEELRSPDSDAVARFAADHPEEVAFHAFTQWLARESLGEVQQRARRAGMAIGLVGDLAVGVDPAGADAWAMRDDLLDGLTIGAPPDPLGPLGQNWMLTSFSPQGLKRSGYAPWIRMVRAALATSGALRIDHAFGLARLWVVPEGEDSCAGAYLEYPFTDLVRLVALEAHRAGALIIAEDLGTAPHGFLSAIESAAMLGMRVLWFERAADQGFIGAADYAVEAVAMTGTHDTATVAGWWTGRDLDWAEALGRLPDGTTRTDAEDRRAWDRGLLWATLTGDHTPRPAPENPGPVVAAALAHIGRTPSRLAIVPLEDLLAEVEQPNLPGTVTEHPNWRRRLAAPLAELLAQPDTAARIRALANGRAGTGE